MSRASAYEGTKDSILNTLGEYLDVGWRTPSLRGLAERYGVSVSTMHSWLTKMREEGLIEWPERRHRKVRLTPTGNERFEEIDQGDVEGARLAKQRLMRRLASALHAMTERRKDEEN